MFFYYFRNSFLVFICPPMLSVHLSNCYNPAQEATRGFQCVIKVTNNLVILPGEHRSLEWGFLLSCEHSHVQCRIGVHVLSTTDDQI